MIRLGRHARNGRGILAATPGVGEASSAVTPGAGEEASPATVAPRSRVPSSPDGSPSSSVTSVPSSSVISVPSRFVPFLRARITACFFAAFRSRFSRTCCSLARLAAVWGERFELTWRPPSAACGGGEKGVSRLRPVAASRRRQTPLRGRACRRAGRRRRAAPAGRASDPVPERPARPVRPTRWT